MTAVAQHTGAEYGVEKKNPDTNGWQPMDRPGLGFKTYEKTYQIVLEIVKALDREGFHDTKFRIVVYTYDGLKRTNIQVLTIFPEEKQEKIKEEVDWPIWTGPDGATDKELYGPDND